MADLQEVIEKTEDERLTAAVDELVANLDPRLLLGYAVEKVQALTTERDQLNLKLGEARKACRYALATFRALDQYTFEDSDHGLLIAEAVKKLEPPSQD